MNPLQKQLVAGDGQLFMDKPDLTGKVRPREFYYGSPPAPQKVTAEEFLQSVAHSIAQSTSPDAYVFKATAVTKGTTNP